MKKKTQTKNSIKHASSKGGSRASPKKLSTPSKPSPKATKGKKSPSTATPIRTPKEKGAGRSPLEPGHRRGEGFGYSPVNGKDRKMSCKSIPPWELTNTLSATFQTPPQAEAKTKSGTLKKLASKSIHKPIPKLADKTTSFIIEKFGSVKSVQVKSIAERKNGSKFPGSSFSTAHQRLNTDALGSDNKDFVLGKTNPACPVQPPEVPLQALRPKVLTGFSPRDKQTQAQLPFPEDVPAVGKWVCERCAKHFKCKAGLSTHRSQGKCRAKDKVTILANTNGTLSTPQPSVLQCSTCKGEFRSPSSLELHIAAAHTPEFPKGAIRKTPKGLHWKVTYKDQGGEQSNKTISIEKYGEELAYKIARTFVQQGEEAGNQLKGWLNQQLRHTGIMINGTLPIEADTSNDPVTKENGNLLSKIGQIQRSDKAVWVPYKDEASGQVRRRTFSIKHYGREHARYLAEVFLHHGEEKVLQETKRIVAMRSKETELKKLLSWKARTKCYEANFNLKGETYRKSWPTSEDMTRETALAAAEDYLRSMKALDSFKTPKRKGSLKRPRSNDQFTGIKRRGPLSFQNGSQNGEEKSTIDQMLEDISDDDRESLCEDIFDDNYNLPSGEERICAFCHGNEMKGHAMLGGLKCEREEEVWLDRERPLVVGKRRVWVHRFCALFSPRAIILGGKWYNVTKEIQRGRRIKCSRCKKPGGTLGCSKQRCSVSCHFHCARLDGWMPSTMAVHINPFVCQEHMLKDREEEVKSWGSKLEDISGGREILPVTSANEVDNEPCPADFTYVTRHVDSDSFSLEQHLQDLKCCNCQDNCVHPEKCACLQKMHGKVYNSMGCLMPNPPPVVYECNTRCFCTTHGCSNQVVANGLRFRLQVFRKASTSSDDNLERWGVRSLDPIPQGGYVCEMVGQVIALQSKEEPPTRFRLRHISQWQNNIGDKTNNTSKKKGKVEEAKNFTLIFQDLEMFPDF
eukprot:CAMPEP_0117734970 /NCGR_PEP_ID=MMETSP0947-20121206/1004_1 /TAXON_ID=44440 /ORGANISM="Chattonella subsalsa, Strain CCMP2191" /LENGTH=966 /DNA_ID=CAMNT_0005549877 /DNA_START=229 /DNA_END=3130 /DNA_ORIENTATION=+